MATLNLGRIKPIFKGAYAGGTAYVVDDIVTSGNETFICILASTGNATSNATYWTKLAAKGTDGTDVGATITTQGDILYRDGSGVQRLAKPASDLFLQNTSGGVLSWAAAGGGKVGQVVAVHHTAQESTTSTSFVDVPNIVIAITPTAASSKIMVMYTLTVGVDDQQLCFNMMRDINSGGYAQVSMGDASGVNTRVNNAYSGTSYYWDYMPFSMSHQYLDTPSYSVGNAITYKLQWRVLGGTSYINSSRDQTDHVNYVRSPSQISAWEILA
jgi:hypothetical protein